MTTTRPLLRGISEIRHYFFSRERPVVYFDTTPFQLLGMDEWVRGFRYVSYSNCFDGHHPHCVVPPQLVAHTYPFASLEDCNNQLLVQPVVREAVTRWLDDAQAKPQNGYRGDAFFMMFNERTVELAAELGLRVLLPDPKVRREADSKTHGTRIGDRADVPSVPNRLGPVRSYEELRELAGPLGEDLVVQLPYGDSGITTFFISSAEDFAREAESITREREVKVMKRINCRQAAIEACVTRAGTLVGPLVSELVGFPELTPFKGGWCGNEACPEIFSNETMKQATLGTQRIGDVLGSMGYRGYFELDYLVDVDTGQLYLGEINPRLTGASSMTNLAAFAHADAPLFLFHLLEYSDVDFELDIDELNERWADPRFLDSWSQMVIKHVEPHNGRIMRAPDSGVWKIRTDNTGCDYMRMQLHRRIVTVDEEAFFLRIAAVGEEVQQGDDLGVLVKRGRLMNRDHQLTDRAQAWIAALRAEFDVAPV